MPVGHLARQDTSVPPTTDQGVGSSKLLCEMRDLIRRKHYSTRTDKTYLGWAKRYILFHGKRHPNTTGEREIVAFLNHLAVERSFSASTQNQVFNALVFLYKQLLGREALQLENIASAKQPERLPTVFDRSEVERLFAYLEGTPKLVASLLYGSGLRLIEALCLRVQDIEFERSRIIVRSGKGVEDCVTLLPSGLAQPIRAQLKKARVLHQQDLANGLGVVYLPYALPDATTPRLGPGNTSFPPTRRRSTRAQARRDAITSVHRPFSARSRRQSRVPASTSRAAAIRCGTASPRTCSKTATTSGSCRSCSATAMYERL